MWMPRWRVGYTIGEDIRYAGERSGKSVGWVAYNVKVEWWKCEVERRRGGSGGGEWMEMESWSGRSCVSPAASTASFRLLLSCLPASRRHPCLPASPAVPASSPSPPYSKSILSLFLHALLLTVSLLLSTFSSTYRPPCSLFPPTPPFLLLFLSFPYGPFPPRPCPLLGNFLPLLLFLLHAAIASRCPCFTYTFLSAYFSLLLIVLYQPLPLPQFFLFL